MPDEARNDFTKGSMWKNILSLALPMTAAQMVNLLYSVVDRMYIGHIPEASTLALTGLGLTFPIIMILTAFANLFGTGGAPLCSIARGRGDHERAQRIMGNSFCMLMASGLVLMALCFLFKRPILYLFGASESTYPYASDYLSIYLCGTLFVMTGLGMNSFINSQGFGKVGMLTVVLGAAANIVLDPIFIFVFGMGIRGAALATVLSQMLSSVWILRFLCSGHAIYSLRFQDMRPDWRLIREIVALGLSGFIMAVTNSIVQIACNATLQRFGGDLYVGIMTVLSSVREVITMPANGLTNGAQPVLGYNYGAGEYRRVRSGILFISIVCVSFTFIMWILLLAFPRPFIHVFNSDPLLLERGVSALHIYFFGFFMMSLQFSAQSAFVALGYSRHAVFFSIFRKVIIVTPLTILLPHLGGLGVNGVFLAEPISNFVGGIACYTTMLLTLWPQLRKDPKTPSDFADLDRASRSDE